MWSWNALLENQRQFRLCRFKLLLNWVWAVWTHAYQQNGNILNMLWNWKLADLLCNSEVKTVPTKVSRCITPSEGPVLWPCRVIFPCQKFHVLKITGVKEEALWGHSPSLLIKIYILSFVTHFETVHIPWWETQVASYKKHVLKAWWRGKNCPQIFDEVLGEEGSQGLSWR